MCTLVVMRRPGHAWPLILAANRDEMTARPWLAPAKHWPDRPDVIAGLDRLGGGSWLGLNRRGVVAGVLNRRGSLGPEPGKRSRGDLILLALEGQDASAAAEAVQALEPAAFRSYNMIIADPGQGFWIRHSGGASRPETTPLPEGLSMITAGDLNAADSPRIRAHRPRLKAAAVPDPGQGDWTAWQEIMADPSYSAADGPAAAMNLDPVDGFATVSSSLIAVPGPGLKVAGRPVSPIWLFAAGRPDRTPYKPVKLFG